jgi:hypothetical protein
MEKDKKTIDDRIRIALDNPSIPRISFNGFVSSLGTGDVLIVLENNQMPVAILNASYTVSKTFAAKLTGLIETLEKRSESNIMTTDEIEVFMSKENKDEK